MQVDCWVDVLTLLSGKNWQGERGMWEELGERAGRACWAIYHAAALGEAEEEGLSFKTICELRDCKTGGGKKI